MTSQRGTRRTRSDEIAEDASRIAAGLIAEAVAEGEKQKTAAGIKLEAIKAEYGRKLYEEIERMRTASSGSTDAELAAEFEKVHRDSLLGVKEKFISMVRNLDSGTRSKWTSALIAGAASELGAGVLHVRKEDVPEAAGYSGFEIVPDLSASGGVVAEASDGTALLDYTLESLAESYWESSIGEILELLFG